MRSIGQDIRYALRQMHKSLGFAITVVAVLALGIGANIAVFTLLNGVLLRPLPYANADRLVSIELAGPMPYYTLTYANMLQLRDAVGAQLKIGAEIYEGSQSASIVGSGGRFQVTRSSVTAGLFDMLGVQPVLGRGFRADENEPGKNHVLLLGDDVWRKVFNADPSIVGKTLNIRQQPYTIVGVLPKGFFFSYYDDMAVWSPAGLTAANRSAMAGREMKFGSLYALLPKGMSAAQLAADLSRTQAVIAKEPTGEELPTRVKVADYRLARVGDARKPLFLLYAVVFGVWALACLNVTSLMLTNAVGRSREQAVRAALGASRRRLLQQSAVESLLLSTVGALTGLLLGQAGIKLLWRQIEHHLPLSRTIHMDWRVVACLAALAVLTAVIAGVFPALRAMRRDVQNDLRGVNTIATAGANPTREALVIGQLALTLVFLAGAGLFLRTIHALRQVPLGFAQQNVLTGGVILNSASNGESGNLAPGEQSVVTGSYMPLLDRLRAIPGVRVAAMSSVLPFRREMSVSISTTIDHHEVPDSKQPVADGRISSPGLVDALGIPMIRGRFFADDDTPSSPPVVVINQAFANKFLPGQDPIGHVVSMSKTGRFSEIRIVAWSGT